MSRHRKQINMHFIDVDWQMSYCLHRVNMKINTVLFADLTDLCDWFDRTDFIVCMHDTDQDRLWADRFFYIIWIHHTILCVRKSGNIETIFLQPGNAVENRMVFDAGSNHM